VGSGAVLLDAGAGFTLDDNPLQWRELRPACRRTRRAVARKVRPNSPVTPGSGTTLVQSSDSRAVICPE
ncbi:MAG: hypothetical protein ACREJC_15455, partial [Tepidisphaeraceae bacterium]